MKSAEKRIHRRCAIVFLTVMSILVCTAEAQSTAKKRRTRPKKAGISSSKWRVEEAACRVCFEKGYEDFILTRVPLRITNSFVSAIVAYSGNNTLTNSVVFKDEEQLYVLINATAVKRSSRVNLYLVAGGKAVKANGASLLDPTPLHGRAARTAGMDYPETREQADSLTTRFDRAPKRFAVATFDNLGDTFKDWYSGNWQRKNHLVDLQSWILVPKGAEYVFGLAGTAPSWLDINGKQVAEHPSFQPFDQWSASEPVQLDAGLHRVLVRTVLREKIDTGLAWKRQGEDDVAKDVVMVTGVDLSTGRWEWSDSDVHPHFIYTVGEPYRFKGIEALFVPLSFENNSACTAGASDFKWDIGGVDYGTNSTLNTTIASTTLPVEASLTVTASDTQESDTYTESISYRGPVWKEYDVTSRMSGIPAVCYAEDAVHPIVRVRTSAIDEFLYVLESEIEMANGEKIRRSDSLRTAHGWGNQYLPQFAAGSLKAIGWSLKHCGHEISAGRVLFQHDPFTVVPDALSGELFRSGADFIVLIASRQSAEREVVAEKADKDGEVMFLDGFVFDDLCSLSSNHQVYVSQNWNWQSVSELKMSPHRTGNSLLQSFSKINEALTAGTVFYAPDLGAIAAEGGSDGFERRLAAMCGLLVHQGSEAPRVILVVPPPFEKLPDLNASMISRDAATDRTLDARRVAEIIMRVADVYGVETVDLYSAFELAGKTTHQATKLIEGSKLTDAGRELAYAIIARKL